MKTILVCNVGSGSFKAALFDKETLALCQRFKVDYDAPHPCLCIESSEGILQESIGLTNLADSALPALLSHLEYHHAFAHVGAVGHRVVHGGEHFIDPAWINNETTAALHALVPLAPLHQPHNLKPIEQIRQAHPHLPQVVCFDTAFHHTMPWKARTYALPQELQDKGVKRYGFHGLSYEYIASFLSEALPEESRARVVAIHLGSGCSACALQDGKSIATTMGFTALDGLMMRTRCGSLDPGVVLYLLRTQAYDPHTLEHILYEESGLKGIAGSDGDIRDVLKEAHDKEWAEKALELFCHMAAQEIGGLVAVLGGAQAFIFTGAIGVHMPEIRTRIMRYFEWMGNMPVLALPTNEELIIASHTRDMLHGKRW